MPPRLCSWGNLHPPPLAHRVGDIHTCISFPHNYVAFHPACLNIGFISLLFILFSLFLSSPYFLSSINAVYASYFFFPSAVSLSTMFTFHLFLLFLLFFSLPFHKQSICILLSFHSFSASSRPAATLHVELIFLRHLLLFFHCCLPSNSSHT